MTGCRIGKVTPKDKKLAVLRVPERAYVHNSVHGLSGAIREDSIIAAFFVIHADRTTTTGWSHIAGITDTEFLGGTERLKIEWIRREML